MKLDVNDKVHLTEVRSFDKPALVQHLNDRDIYDRTLRIPYPYTETAADEWFARSAKLAEQQGRQTHFAIRLADSSLIGCCGFDGSEAHSPHRAEIGYWLARPYWGQGIMTAVVRRLCRCAFDEYGLTKITANVFAYNPASARVLEKCGFQQEGFLRKHFLKDGALLDSRLFALLRPDAEMSQPQP